MWVNIISGILTVIILICVVRSIYVFRKTPKEERNVHYMAYLAPIIISGVAAITTGITAINPERVVEVIIPEISDVLDDNTDLEIQNEKLNEQVTSLTEKNEELQKLVRYDIAFKKYKMYFGDREITADPETSFIEVNDKLYFAQEVIENLTDDDVKLDEENDIVYIGKYPETQVSLLSACEPYDMGEGFSLASEQPFKIQSNTYRNGFRLDAYYGYQRTVKFNLNNRYTQLSFRLGHIDETDLNHEFILRIYVDNNVVQEIVCDPNVDFDNVYVVPLNYGKILTFEWTMNRTVNINWNASYGVVDPQLK